MGSRADRGPWLVNCSGIAAQEEDHGPAPAERADVQFAFGGDNPGRALGRLGYCRRMVEECALTPEDLWSPKPDGEKPVQVRERK